VLNMPANGAGPTIAFGTRRAAAGSTSFLDLGPAPAGGRAHRVHGLRVRKQAELMGITPGTARLTQQTGHTSWVTSSADDGAEEEIEVELEEEVPTPRPWGTRPPAQPQSAKGKGKGKGKAKAVKTELQAVKSEQRAPLSAADGSPLTERELFVERRRSEATLRDLACKAICRIKQGLRQHSQEDGRAFVPKDWDSVFKPTLGPYIKFLLTRPDQFRVVEGRGPGLFTIEDVTGNKTVVAPSWDELAAAKGKGKGKGKKGKGKEFDAPGKGKGDGKAKGGKSKSKGKGKDWEADSRQPGTKGKGKQAGKRLAPQPPSKPPPTSALAAAQQSTPVTSALAAALAEGNDDEDTGPQVAMDEVEFEVAAEESDQLREELQEAAEEAEADQAEMDEAEAEEAFEEAWQNEETEQSWPQDEEQELADDKSYLGERRHGSLISAFLAGDGLLGHKRSSMGPEGDAKRAR